VVRDIRDLNPDVAVLLPNSIRSALTVWLGGVKEIYGYRRSGRSLLLTGGPKPPRNGERILPIPMVDYYMEICRWLGLNIQDVIKPSLFISESTHKRGEQLLDRYGIEPDDMVIGMNPGAKFGSSKCWPAEYFATLAELLTKRWECKILLFAGPGEGDIAKSIIEASKASIINTFPDNDLAVLKHLIKRCRLLVTTDAGPRHYAVAFDVPVVVLMGPTDPRYTASNLEKTIVLRRELACSPCYKKRCPYDHACMRGILPEEVLQESEKLLT
jgi:heptosyltransferase-2